MPRVTTEEAYRLAVIRFQQGQLAEAESICRQVLCHDPQHGATLALMGLIAGGMGRHESAAGFLESAIKCNPKSPSLLSNLGESYRRLGRFKLAVAKFQQAIALKPDYVQAYNNLGVAYKDWGELERALHTLRKAVELDPKYSDAIRNLGIVLLACNQPEEACLIFQDALKLAPTDAQLQLILGVALVASKRADEAERSFIEAIRLDPKLGVAHGNLGTLLKNRSLLDEAIEAYKKALALDPDVAEIHCSLATTFMECGRIAEALAAFRRAIALKPDHEESQSGLLFCLNYDIGSDSDVQRRELRRWSLRHGSIPVPVHQADRDAGRRLRIGYVSPDFREHVVARFLLPILENHDRDEFELYCYSQVADPDDVTERCRAASLGWKSLVGLSDQQAAEVIRGDRIDILVDLALHTANNRLLVFQHKPAPVQVTYLAYAGTSGLVTMDYRLSDEYLDPPEMVRGDYSEETVRLPATYWCYRPVLSPPIAPLPAKEAGHITFGCLSNFSKINDAVLTAWSELLRRVEGGRLLLHAPAGSSVTRIRGFFEKLGIDPARISFVDRLPLPAYLDLYNQIDICLDPFPFGGGTTTLDALWMGVPVVSVAGKRAVGRGGLSILSNLGLQGLVGQNASECVQIAGGLACDLQRLEQLRNELRHLMEKSQMMNESKFVRDLESAYRWMWRRWCSSEGG